jgi:hypothetical protein
MDRNPAAIANSLSPQMVEVLASGLRGMGLRSKAIAPSGHDEVAEKLADLLCWTGLIATIV